MQSIVGQENLGGEDEMVVGEGDKEEQKFLLLKNSEMDKIVINFGIADQSKCVFGEKYLKEGDFENDLSRHDKIVHPTLPVITFNLEEKPVDDFTGTFSIPSSAPIFVPGLNMAVEELSDYLHDAKDNEESAWDLQGLIFHDNELGWCPITDWGVDHGTNIVFYSPVDSKTPSRRRTCITIRGFDMDSTVTCARKDLGL